MHFWHLFSTAGFPKIVTYGQAWEPWLILAFVASRALMLAAHLFFLAVFVKAAFALKHYRVDETAARVHMPRVIGVYIASSAGDVILNTALIVAFWWPAYRFIACLTFLSAALLLAASLKTWWAYSLCVRRGPTP